jgi:N-acetylglutamate synthase-like GNAT family acetyltransferase
MFQADAIAQEAWTCCRAGAPARGKCSDFVLIHLSATRAFAFLGPLLHPHDACEGKKARSSAMIQVRLANTSEEKAAQELAAVAFAELRSIYVPTPSARAQAASTAGTFSRLVALDDQEVIVGTVLYRIEGDRFHVRGLAVDPKARRRGIARSLLEFIFREALASGLRALSLYTVAETGNTSLFECLGFRTMNQSFDETSELVRGCGRPTLSYMERAVR